MSELRYDPTLDEWVIVASERAARQRDLPPPAKGAVLPEREPGCPFCPGNEHMTPPPTLVEPGPRGWQVRVVPNRYPLVGEVSHVAPPGEPPAPGEWYARYAAGGAHEVAIVSPSHCRWLPALAPDEALALARALRARYQAVAALPAVRQVLIFENHGAGAGASLAHPHVQIVGLPVVTPTLRRRRAAAERYAARTGRRLWPDLLAAELAAGERVIWADEEVVVWAPFAGRMPFELWLAPRAVQPSFGALSDREVAACIAVLRAALAALERAIGPGDVNYVLHSAPPEWAGDIGLSWFIQVLPRTTTLAGLELGSGMGVTTISPEAAAERLRAVWAAAQ